MKKQIAAVIALACTLSMTASAAEFIGELYGFWYDNPVECELFRYWNGMEASPTWRSDFVEVDGVREPAQLGCDGFIFPVSVSAGETFEAEIVHGTSTDAHIKSVTVLTDAQMYAMFRWTEEYPEAIDALWPMGRTLSTRVWIAVEHANVTTGTTYPLDLDKMPIVNLQYGDKFYNPYDDIGGLSSIWTISQYAAAFGASLSGVRYVTESVHYTVGIKGGERFPQRVWNVCDPFQGPSADSAAIDMICDNGGHDSVFDETGLFFVAPSAKPATEPTFTGELYMYWYYSPVDCELSRYWEGMEDSPKWRSGFVEVDGVREPAQWGCDGFAFPVSVPVGKTVEAEIVHGTSTDAHFKSVTVLTDAQMYAMFRWTEEYPEAIDALWPMGRTLSTRVWIAVEHANVTTGTTYPLDLDKMPIVNLQYGDKFYNPYDDIGGLSSIWTISQYAAAFGASLSGVRYVTESVHYTVGIKGGERFPQRVWNVCDPFQGPSADSVAIDTICDNGGHDSVFDRPGLFFVAPGTEPTTEYRIAFAPGSDGVAPSMPEQVVGAGKVAKLNPCAFAAPAGKKFAGWRRNDNGRRYDDGVMVFNLAEPGETVKLTAIWE